MAKNKGSNYRYAVKLLEQKGEQATKAFIDQLTPEEKKFHENTLEISWLDADLVSRLLSKIGKIIFPDKTYPLRECGRLEAQDHLTGMYRILLKLLTVEMVMKQSAKIWKQYHDTGVASVVKKGDKHIALLVEDYAELTPELRDIVAGYCLGTVELTGVHGLDITIDDQDPQKWQFNITWK